MQCRDEDLPRLSAKNALPTQAALSPSGTVAQKKAAHPKARGFFKSENGCHQLPRFCGQIFTTCPCGTASRADPPH